MDPYTPRLLRHVEEGRIGQMETVIDRLCVERDGLQMDGLDAEGEVVQLTINTLVAEVREARKALTSGT